MPAAAPDLQGALVRRGRMVGRKGLVLEKVEELSPAALSSRILEMLYGDASAEDVVQDTWAVVLEDVDRFEGRSTLRSWIFGILGNLARTRATRDGRAIPLSALEAADGEPAVDPAEFLPPSHPRWAGHWAKWPEPWPEEQLLTREALAHVRDAIARLPEGQRAVIQLRDVEDWSSEEVCEALGLSDVNQRVLLHRARSRVRREIARHVERRRP